MPTLRVFEYIAELDAFLVTQEFTRVSDYLGLTEWHPVVWIGRLFTMDNDLGEHWFDLWDKEYDREAKAATLGVELHELLVLSNDPFQDGRDGPCHSPALRRRFWTDVLKSLELSYGLLFEEARYNNEGVKTVAPEEFIPNLDERIAQMQASLARTGSPFDAAEPAPLQ